MTKGTLNFTADEIEVVTTGSYDNKNYVKPWQPNRSYIAIKTEYTPKGGRVTDKIEAAEREQDRLWYEGYKGDAEALKQQAEALKTELKKVLTKALEKAFPDYKLTFSHKAGCKMCSCSPGWLMVSRETGNKEYGTVYWLKVTCPMSEDELLVEASQEGGVW